MERVSPNVHSTDVSHACRDVRLPWQPPRLQMLVTSSMTQLKHSGCKEQGTSFPSYGFCS